MSYKGKKGTILRSYIAEGDRERVFVEWEDGSCDWMYTNEPTGEQKLTMMEGLKW